MSTTPRPPYHDCGGTIHEGEHFTCGRVVLMRDPTNPADACPGGLTVCVECVDEFTPFLKVAYDARAVRQEMSAD
jgi:hypothetical protein